jgi:hypothetical protein
VGPQLDLFKRYWWCQSAHDQRWMCVEAESRREAGERFTKLTRGVIAAHVLTEEELDAEWERLVSPGDAAEAGAARAVPRERKRGRGGKAAGGKRAGAT